MANRDPSVFASPDSIDLARTGNRHASFGLGIHRCIGSNVARMVFKRMLIAVLDRMPDYRCDPAGTVHYDSIGVIQGMRHLPAVFTPGRRLGADLAETIAWRSQSGRSRKRRARCKSCERSVSSSRSAASGCMTAPPMAAVSITARIRASGLESSFISRR
jgi:hypothetical protein